MNDILPPLKTKQYEVPIFFVFQRTVIEACRISLNQDFSRLWCTKIWQLERQQASNVAWTWMKDYLVFHLWLLFLLWEKKRNI